MQPADARRAVAATTAIASAQGLTVEDAVVLHDSNKLTLRLLPCGVVARVAHRGQEVSRFEVEIARGLAAAGSPVAALDPRVEPRVHEADGFVVTLWTYYAPVGPPEPPPDAVVDALQRLHAGLRTLTVAAPHVTDRIAQARRLVAHPELTPALPAADRTLLGTTLDALGRALADRGAPEQLIHGEPHPGNVLGTRDGLRFVDLETCCRGPIELDLAHAPVEVGRRYPHADQELLGVCRGLVLALVSAWRWEAGDQLPDGRRAAHDLLSALRAGPPWPALEVTMRRPDG